MCVLYEAQSERVIFVATNATQLQEWYSAKANLPVADAPNPPPLNCGVPSSSRLHVTDNLRWRAR